jgi:hypothetical protein
LEYMFLGCQFHPSEQSKNDSGTFGMSHREFSFQRNRNSTLRNKIVSGINYPVKQAAFIHLKSFHNGIVFLEEYITFDKISILCEIIKPLYH